MVSTLFVLNEAPYGKERAYNVLRPAGALRGTLAQLADWTVEVDKVLVF